MRRLAFVAAAVAAGVLSTLLSSPTATAAATAATASPPTAVPRWSMVPLTKDVNHDGLIDGDGGVPATGAMSTHPSARRVGAGNHVAQPNERLINGNLSWYLPAGGYPVRLDACSSRGDTYRWTVSGAGQPDRTTPARPVRRARCAQTIDLPEGAYTATLQVTAGASTTRSSIPVTVRNLLVVALGDSYASGEGNPRNVQAWLAEGPPITPYWDDDACDRSVQAGPARAALTLEQQSTTTSVTFVDLACSGATVDAGILGPQASAGQSLSQVQQARSLLGDRPIDDVLLSVGGNDVGFSDILRTCALDTDCATRLNGPVQARTRALPAAYARIAACLGGSTCRLADGSTTDGLVLAPDARVLPTLYPDITRAANGQPCAYLSISAKDFAWARSSTLDPTPPPSVTYPLSSGGSTDLPVTGSLNQQIAATSRLPGWQPVLGSWSASGAGPTGHGVCAGAQAWVFGVTAFAGLPSASFHPNPTGQQVMGDAITAQLGAT